MTAELDQMHRVAKMRVNAAKMEAIFLRAGGGTDLKVKDGDAALKRSVQAILRDRLQSSAVRAAAATTLIEAKVMEAVA